MGDYVYPSIFFSYFLFFLFLVGGIFFFVRSFRDGYWGSKVKTPSTACSKTMTRQARIPAAAALRRHRSVARTCSFGPRLFLIHR